MSKKRNSKADSLAKDIYLAVAYGSPIYHIHDKMMISNVSAIIGNNINDKLEWRPIPQSNLNPTIINWVNREDYLISETGILIYKKDGVYVLETRIRASGARNVSFYHDGTDTVLQDIYNLAFKDRTAPYWMKNLDNYGVLQND